MMWAENTELVNKKVPKATHATGEVGSWPLGNCFSILCTGGQQNKPEP